MSAKKTLLTIVIILMGAMLLSACNTAEPATEAPTVAEPVVEDAGEADEPESVTLSILTNWGESDPKGPVLQKIIDEFTAANPNVEIVVEIVPDTDLPTKVETSFLANQEADIILHNWMGPSTEWLQDGIVVPVTDYLTEWGLKDNFKQDALDNYKVGDDYAAFPLEGFNWPMWYNMAILEEAGVQEIPSTFDELIEVAEKVRAAGYQPFALGGNDWTGGDWFLTVATAALGNETAADLFANGGFSSNEDARRFVEEFVRLRDAGVFVDNAEGMEFQTMNAAFFDGEAAMMHGGSWSYAEIPAEVAEHVKLGGIPLPAGAKGATKPFWYSSYEAKGLWISRNGATKIDTVKLFTQMFFEEQNIAAFVEAAAMIPPYKSIEVDESVLPTLFVQSLSLDIETVDHATVAFAPSTTFDAWYGVTATAFVPGTTVDEILAAMDDIYQ